MRISTVGLLAGLLVMAAQFISAPALAQDDPGQTASDSLDAEVAERLPECPPELDETGVQLWDEEGRLVFQQTVRVRNEAGEPVLGDDGEPQMTACAAPAPACPRLRDENGEAQSDEAGAPLYAGSLPVLDADGAPVLDEDGNPRTIACAIPAEAGPDDATGAAETPTLQPEPASLFDPIRRLINAGGPIITLLILLGLLTLAVALVKCVQYLWLGVGFSGFVSARLEDLKAGRDRDVLEELERKRNPVARVMGAAVRGKMNPRMSDELVREEVTRIAQAQLDGLERGLALLSLIATIAPLLGLLGTVLGMIEAFQQMASVGDRVEPAVLAGGIWEALLTTAAGLTVAIPAAVFFTWFQRSVDVEGQRMESAATQVYTAPLYDSLSQSDAQSEAA